MSLAHPDQRAGCVGGHPSPFVVSYLYPQRGKGERSALAGISLFPYPQLVSLTQPLTYSKLKERSGQPGDIFI
jgi:hypothetical protein